MPCLSQNRALVRCRGPQQRRRGFDDHRCVHSGIVLGPNVHSLRYTMHRWLIGPAICLYFAALRSTTNPFSVPLPRVGGSRKVRSTRHEPTVLYQLSRSLHTNSQVMVFLHPHDPTPRAGIPKRSGPHRLRTAAPCQASTSCPELPRCGFAVHLNRDQPAALVPGPLCERSAGCYRLRWCRLHGL